METYISPWYLSQQTIPYNRTDDDNNDDDNGDTNVDNNDDNDDNNSDQW